HRLNKILQVPVSNQLMKTAVVRNKRIFLKDSIALLCLLLCTHAIPLAQNARANGYKGIWFTLGQFSGFGDKYSGGLGTYTSSHVPVAIYSKPANKTFFVYGGTTQKDQKH